jgi:hypothetical protein
MALTRRCFLTALPFCAGAMLACSGPARNRKPDGAYAELFVVKPEQRPRGTILVCMPETRQTKEVWLGLNDELGRDFELVAVRLGGRGGASIIAQGVQRHRPAGLVLMNNPTVTAYRELQRTTRPQHFPPAVVVMTSFLDEYQRQVADWVGISYEVPLITVVTNLRKLIATPIERVGVIHRTRFSGFVSRQASLARREQISVFPQPVSDNPNPSELKWALRRLKQQADAIWVLNDDRLLTPLLITEGWLPGLNERPFKPTIVGAASLVSPANSFGTFAMLPDHTALGVQAANLVFDLADNHFAIGQAGETQLPLSTTTTVDLVQARERFNLRADALKQVDRILQ